jgi:4-hydroxy-tetrahydrodipicolinate reductase
VDQSGPISADSYRNLKEGMEMRKIRAIVYGVGAIGKLTTRFMVEKCVDIVGAIDVNLEIVGKDLGEVAGLGRPLNVIINNNADAVLSEQAADIAIVAVFTDLERMYPIFKNCIEHGLNVLHTAGGSSYNWSTHPELTSKLDKVAKEHNVTIAASGYQDSFMINMVMLLTGASHTIESITGRQRYNLDQFGLASIKQYLAGETKEEFYRNVKGEQTIKGAIFNRVSLENIIAGLGLTLKAIEIGVEPTIDEVDVESKTLRKVFKKGQVTGMAKIAEAETEQGIKFREEEIAKFYNDTELTEGDINEWIIKGIPEIHVKNDKVLTGVTTCSQIVNRIPDIIDSEPGYLTVDRLPKLRFKTYPLHYYLGKGFL